LFPTERRCDRVFSGFSSTSTADLSFMDVCREFTLQLLNFADAIAIGSRSPEQLISIFDMFETMCDLILEFEFLFRDQYSLSLQYEATTIWKILGEAIRGISMELDRDIGRLHLITCYVMNYLHAASLSRKTLEQVYEEDYGNALKEYPKIDEDRVHCSNTSLSVQM
jgi:hypothetical protein